MVCDNVIVKFGLCLRVFCCLYCSTVLHSHCCAARKVHWIELHSIDVQGLICARESEEQPPMWNSPHGRPKEILRPGIHIWICKFLVVWYCTFRISHPQRQLCEVPHDKSHDLLPLTIFHTSYEEALIIIGKIIHPNYSKYHKISFSIDRALLIVDYLMWSW